MTIVNISSGEIQIPDKLKESLALVDQKEDDFFTPGMLADIAESLQDAKEGKGVRVSSKEELIRYLNSL
ncbi:MAG: hypothetical protein LBQ73_00660 [Tannerellaceae bacterium]|jgi:hypothetical protein|nr:hypothetical protein [Tannerellaceae bacterium]